MFKRGDKLTTTSGVTLEISEVHSLKMHVTVQDGRCFSYELKDWIPRDTLENEVFVGELLYESPHVELMREYAKDWATNRKPYLLWEFFDNDKAAWVHLNHHPSWEPFKKYRRRAKRITINGHEVLEPYRGHLECGVTYYIVDPVRLIKYVTWRFDYGSVLDEMERLQELGLVHTTKEAAVEHAKALLSFTESKA